MLPSCLFPLVYLEKQVKPLWRTMHVILQVTGSISKVNNACSSWAAVCTGANKSCHIRIQPLFLCCRLEVHIVLIYFSLLDLLLYDKLKEFLSLNEVEPKPALSVKLLSLAKVEIHFGAGIVNTSHKQPHTSTSFSVPEAATASWRQEPSSHLTYAL